MKKKPKIFQNDITKTINNNKKICYLKEEPSEQLEDRISLSDLETQVPEETKEQTIPVNEVLDQIFSGFGYSYNIPVTIETPTKTYNTSLITKTSLNVITLDNDVIPIETITKITINKITH